MENIEVELSDSEFLSLARQAHDLDITFNQLVNNILADAMGIDTTHQRFEKIVNEILLATAKE